MPAASASVANVLAIGAQAAALDAALDHLLEWLPPQQCVSQLALLSSAARAAVRQAFEVEARPRQDLRWLLAHRVREFGTVRVPLEGAVLSGALQEPILRSARVAAAAPGGVGAPVWLACGSVCGLVRFRCARLCLQGLLFCGGAPRDAHGSSGPHPRVSLSLASAVVSLRDCTFEVEVALDQPPGPRPSLVERCAWRCSPSQGLVITGARPGVVGAGGDDFPADREASLKAALEVLRLHAREPAVCRYGGGDGDQHRSCSTSTSSSKGLRRPRCLSKKRVAPPRRKGSKDALASSSHDRLPPLPSAEGLCLCVVRDCCAHDVRHHALFLRWDLLVLLEGCSLHGNILIDEEATVELRRNPFIALFGEQLDPAFVGTLRGLQLHSSR